MVTATKETATTVRVATIGDIHCTQTSQGQLRSFFTQITTGADVLVLCGDLTDYGLVEEAQILAQELHAAVTIPIVAVLGNHDFEGGKQHEIRGILCEAGVHMLDGDSCEIHGVGFAGVKGFAGGFGRHVLAPWGEECIKAFVREAVEETLKLETVLTRLRTEQRIAVLHYAPIAATIEGEPLEIYPFLGCSRMEEPLTRYPVTAVVHGHAHHGRFEGRTSNGIPVYNVALPLLRETFPDRPPVHILELSVTASVAQPLAAASSQPAAPARGGITG